MDTPLGKPTRYADGYDATLLAPMERSRSREEQGLPAAPKWAGVDLWRSYEFSWLNAEGLPRVAGLTLEADATSPRMVESKSMKLYLNGFAQTRFESADAVRQQLEPDLGAAFGGVVAVRLEPLAALAGAVTALPGTCLDGLPVAADAYQPDASLLRCGERAAEETVHTELFRSVCPVTGQPDWASVLIRYRGLAIEHESLLRYLVSFRQHAAFHETTVERIYTDLAERCGCERLLVAGFFLRRGGIDINPIRADRPGPWPLIRTARQ
ncbi:MAG: NADPH-dependent 7-cyano-7-deazaguanine reductase QueF [Pseudomonadales bacterium]